MAGYLTTAEIDIRTGILWQHFLTFSNGHNLVVHKAPLKSVTENLPVLPGYSETSIASGITYVPVSGIYPCITVNKSAKDVLFNDISSFVPAGQVKVKVAQDCYDFIRNGQNELFELDGLSYNVMEDESVQNFLGFKFYYFNLKRTT